MIITQQPVSEYAAEVQALAVIAGTSSSDGSPYTVGDGVFQNKIFTAPYNNYEISFALGADITITSGSPGIFTLTGLNATRVSDGIGKLDIDGGTYKQTKLLDFRSQGDTTVATLIGFTSGTIGSYTLASISAKLAVGGQLPYYNSTNGDSVTAKNPLCWGKDYDFTGIPTNHLYGFAGGGAMITPRHLICSNHYEPGNKVGRTIKFYSPSEGIISRTVIAQTTGSDQPTQGLPNNPVISIGDLCVFLLSSDVPGDVKVYPLAGSWAFKSVFDNTSGSISYYDNENSCAFITTNQFRHVLFSVISARNDNWSVPYPNSPVTIGTGISYTRTTSRGGVFKGGLSYSAFAGFQVNAITGDSGSPVFVPLAGHGLALSTVMTYPEQGTLITESLANALILEVDARAGISTGYTITVASSPI